MYFLDKDSPSLSTDWQFSLSPSSLSLSLSLPPISTLSCFTYAGGSAFGCLGKTKPLYQQDTVTFRDCWQRLHHFWSSNIVVYYVNYYNLAAHLKELATLYYERCLWGRLLYSQTVVSFWQKLFSPQNIFCGRIFLWKKVTRAFCTLSQHRTNEGEKQKEPSAKETES